jgi:hypothetical protein
MEIAFVHDDHSGAQLSRFQHWCSWSLFSGRFSTVRQDSQTCGLVQANGGHFHWAANDRKALLGANIERYRNPNYSGLSSIGQTTSSGLEGEN